MGFDQLLSLFLFIRLVFVTGQIYFLYFCGKPYKFLL